MSLLMFSPGMGGHLSVLPDWLFRPFYQFSRHALCSAGLFTHLSPYVVQTVCVSQALLYRCSALRAASLMLRPPPPPPPAGTTGSYSVSESHFFTPIHLHSGLVWTAEAPAEATPGQRKKKEQWVSLEPSPWRPG